MNLGPSSFGSFQCVSSTKIEMPVKSSNINERSKTNIHILRGISSLSVEREYE